MQQPSSSLWNLIEVPHPLLAADEIQSLGEERPVLEAMGFLVPAATVSHIVCPECFDDHVVEVSRVRQRGTSRFFITCPEAGLCEISGDRLRQWSIDCNAIAKALKKALAPAGRNMPLVPGRVWRLGTIPWQQTTRDLVFARGLGWPDAADAARAIEKATRPIVLVPHEAPDEELWKRRVPVVVALSHLSQLCETGLQIDRSHIQAAVTEQESAPAEAGSEVISTKKQKLMVRQQVKAEIESMLTDDNFAAAYEQHGTYRKAAEALSEQTGQEISKDRVWRAVQRKGGSKAVRSETNSNSVRRTVASQRCDNKKKIQNRPEAMDWE